ncbi:MAG: hypothetical protein Q4G08_04055 [Capnocytophaga sp.]|nr:hypothetical protein [Capnocytophaga sp.]
MPHIHYHTDTVAVTREELVPLYWNSWESLRKELGRYKDKPYGIKRLRRGGGRNNSVLIDFDTLPETIKTELGDPRKADNPLELFYLRDGKAARFYQDYTYPDGSSLLPEAIERYTVNAGVMEAVLKLRTARLQEWKGKGKKNTAGLTASLATDAENFKETMRIKFGYEHNLPTSRRFKEALEAYEAERYASLIKDAARNSTKNALVMTEETNALLNAMFGKQPHKPTPAEVSRQYEAFLGGYIEIANAETGECYNPKAFPKLSEASIRNWLGKWENQIGTYALRSGNRQELMGQFSPYYSFENPEFAGSIISVDDRQPPFQYEKGKRMWFYNGIDLASECFTTFVYGKTKEGIILEFYRQMVRNYHAWGLCIPAELEGEISLNHLYQDTFLKNGNMFETVHLYANSARSKRVEAFYKSLRYDFEKKEEGWLARPFAKSEANKSGAAEVPVIPYPQLVEKCVKMLYDWNNTPHSKIKGKTRWEVFCEMQNPDLQPTNYKGILPYLGHHTQSSCNAGITRLHYGECLLGENGSISTGENLIRLMKQVEGKSFDIYWLDSNEGSILKAMLYMDGRYICELLPKPKPNKATIERKADDVQAMEIMHRYAMTVNAFQRTQKNSIEGVEIIKPKQEKLVNPFVIPGFSFGGKPKTTEAEAEIPDAENEYEYVPQQTKTGRINPFSL